uniref:Uncharacterized protein n=1 Tax=uncultured prokaryote TaxID=198431 RepID=H5S971_9ZZZZ|nr:hypothetical protein HGMM_F03A04C30 [uncultured prokaryote]
MAKVIPWEQIKAEYTLGVVNERGERVYPSVRELAQKYRVGMSSIVRHSRREGWVQLREKFRQEVVAEATQKTVANLSDKLAEVNAKGVEGALEMMHAARALLRLFQDVYEKLQQLPRLDKSQQKILAKRVDLMKELSVALRNLQQVHKGGLEAALLALGESEQDQEYTLEGFIRETLKYIEHKEGSPCNSAWTDQPLM